MEKEINFATQETTEVTDENEATPLDLGNDREASDKDSPEEDSQSVIESVEEPEEELMGKSEDESVEDAHAEDSQSVIESAGESEEEEESVEDAQDSDSFMRLYEESLKSIN